MRNRSIQVESDVDGVERITVAIEDQRAGSDRGQSGSREIHILVVVLEGASLPEEFLNLLVPSDMSLLQELPLFIGDLVYSVVAHKRPSLFRIVSGGAHQHHGYDAARLLGGKVQQAALTSSHGGYQEELFCRYDSILAWYKKKEGRDEN